MRTVLAAMLAFLPLVQAQDSAPLKSVEPDYDKYSADLATDFDNIKATVALTIAANGKPFSLDWASVPLPMAVVMALKDYEFRPGAPLVHVPAPTDGSYQVKFDVPVRQSKKPSPEYNIGAGVSKGMVQRRVQPTYPEAARHNRIQGTIVFAAVISEQGEVASLRTSSGPFLLIESAYEAVRQWQYKPYLVKGGPFEESGPVEVLAPIEIHFSLN
jgi:TonB family protein